MVFISDLDWANKMTPQFRDRLEAFLPKWIEDKCVPFYREGKEKGVDYFYFGNFIHHPSGGVPADVYVKDGYTYYWCHEDPDNAKSLALCSNQGLKEYRNINWKGCFCEEYPDFDTASIENMTNNLYYNVPMSRFFNKEKGKNSVLADRCNEYFQELIGGDPDAGFSLSSTSMIWFTELGKRTIFDRRTTD